MATIDQFCTDRRMCQAHNLHGLHNAMQQMENMQVWGHFHPTAIIDSEPKSYHITWIERLRRIITDHHSLGCYIATDTVYDPIEGGMYRINIYVTGSDPIDPVLCKVQFWAQTTDTAFLNAEAFLNRWAGIK